MRIINIILLSLLTIPAVAQNLPLQDINLPTGMHISIYAEHIPTARQLTLAPDGTVFVGSKGDKVYALLPEANFAKARQVIAIANHLNAPNGVAFYKDDLYVAEIHQLIKFPAILSQISTPQNPMLIAKLPTNAWHGYRYIKFGPDGWLYMGIGMPCNICTQDNPLFGTIVRIQANGKNLQIYAKGIRNSVGFAWDPQTNYLWFTDNGRDWLGDEQPPDELNIADKQGLNFGFPYVNGNNIPNPEFANKIPSNINFVKPAYNLPAHVANLGMIFYTGSKFPELKNQILIAEHGSWNRRKKIGYRISLVTIKNGKAIRYNPLISGWLQGESAWGRPVDLLQLPDGSLLISDDTANVIYRIS